MIEFRIGLPGSSLQNTGHWVAQNVELFTHALSGIAIIFIPDKEQNRTVRLNTEHLATLI